MNIKSMVAAAALTAVCLLSLPLRGHSADESTIDTRVILADAGRAAPDFVGIDTWLNSSPLNIADLRRKVVLIDFGPTAATTVSTRCPTSHGSTTTTRTKASSSSASTRRSFLSRDQPGTYKPPSRGTASDIR